MQLISPRQAARALGVSESSLKRWCDQGMIPAVRTVGGHRKVDKAEVLRFARDGRRPCSAPALLDLPVRRRGSAAGVAQARPPLVEALLRGDEGAVRQIVLDLYATGTAPGVLCDEVVAAAFCDIGKRWACREAEVYQERRGCEIALRVLHELGRMQPHPASRQVAVCATLEGEHYLLASAMAEIVLREAGFRAMPLGHGLPLDSLQAAVRQIRPRVVCLCASSRQDDDAFVERINALAQTCREAGAALIVGGRAFSDDVRPRLAYAAYCDTMQHLASLAATLIRPRRSPIGQSNRSRTSATGRAPRSGKRRTKRSS